MNNLNVHRRWTEIGLEPIENYLSLMSQFHFEMMKAVYETKCIIWTKVSHYSGQTEPGS